jgi:hypothetical protein
MPQGIPRFSNGPMPVTDLTIRLAESVDNP